MRRLHWVPEVADEATLVVRPWFYDFVNEPFELGEVLCIKSTFVPYERYCSISPVPLCLTVAVLTIRGWAYEVCTF